MPRCIHPRDSRSSKSRFSIVLIVGLHYGSVLLRCCADSWPPLSLLSFCKHSDPLRDFVLLLPQMENKMMPSWLSPLLKQPLAESFWVFSNPVKILQWILPFKLQNSKSSLLLLCLPAHFLDALLAEYLLSTERSAVLFCTLHLLDSESCALLDAPAQCPPGRALQNPQ
jgi:hypothetical protein